ncbi:gliding motility-associated C-terminal domain-containing protein [Capnocytophaga granulosa]|uniref:gliding motility-associated C-terminal domain-containing protein n=1 Tax=Capnocytophaga granulosa TaxID=45242 RepID=UPI0028EA4B5E|nr:gliding motility-associated C-terminal domain-containing protein [Capnocytophaga granulosa]
MLNKVNRTQQKIFNLLVFIGLLLSGKSFAQSCDPYIQKALEQTHITTFSKVSYGATAKFVIRYPLNDTKYTLTDQDGNTYIYRYSYSQPADEKVTIEIPVGVTTKERRFALKAENGLCTYTTSFDYAIKPISSVTHELAVRVEDEWCDNAAGLFFSVVGQGANNSDYDFYYKKASDAAYPTSPLIAPKVEGIGAGIYDIKVVKKIAPYTTLTQQVTIRADNEPIAYTAQYIPALCTGNGSIRVKVTSRKFPLTYTLINADNGTVVRPRQSSNVFLDVPAGNYKVKVTDNCSFGGGNASTQVVVAANQILNFTQIRVDPDRPLVHEYSCEYVAFKNLELRGLNIEKVWEADAFPYPFEVKWEFVSPTNHTYYYAKNITNRTDLEQAFKLSSGGDQDGHKFLEWKEHVYQSTPKEFGIWRITAHITACGTTQTLPYVARAAEDPMKDITFEMDNAGGCNPAVKAVRYGFYAPYIPVYYVLERYPAHFDPNAAGFYKIHTSHPDMQDKFVKLLDTQTRTLIPSGLLNVGDKVQFRVVSADCPTRSELYQELTIRTGVTESPAVLYLSQVASCKGVTATGTEYASLRIENMYNSAQIARIVITDFTGDRSKLPTGMSIPYVVSDSDRIRKDLWIIKDLPAGTYTIKYTDTCGYEKIRTDAIIEPEAYTLSWSTDCLPKVSGNLAQKPKGNVLYSIERYDTATKTWKPASSNGNPLPILGAEGASESLISGALKGKFRIVRRTFTHTENQDKGPYECTQVLSEKEYKGSLEGLNAVGFGCGTFQPGNPPKYHIALIPKGGQPPYTYTLVTKDGTIVNRPSTDGNFFLNVDPDNLNTRYVFKVRDNCGDERTYDEVISNFLPPQLTTSQEYYCVGQKAILSVPDLGDKIKIEWYRSDNPTHVLHRGTTLEVFPLTEDDFTHTYGVRFIAEYDNDVNACIARANIQAYQLRKANDYPAFTAPNGLSLEKCAPVDTTPEIFDLNDLFINRDITVGQYADLVVRIVDKAGVIEVPANGQVNINSPEYAGRTNTFVYEVVRPCGEVLVRAEATLKVRKTTASDKVKTQVVICQENITYGEVAQLILSQSEAAVSQAALAFHWYTSAQDAQNETNEKQASDAVGTIPNGGNKTLYLRVQQNYLCPSATLSITLSRTSTTALAPKNLGAICALTVGEIKKMIDATEHNKIILYQNGVALADAYQLSSGTSLTYSKQEGTCLTAQSPVTVTIQSHSVAEPKVIPLCTQYWKEYGFSYVNIGELRAALRALYPSAKADGIKIYDQNKNPQNDANILKVDSSALFTIEENNKCPSDYYSVTVLEKEHTPARAETLTLCPNATVGALRTLLVAKGYMGTLKIYKNDGLQMNDSDPVDWNMLDKYTFTIEQAPKCPSRHMTLSLERSTNLTPAVARTVALCSTTTPTVGQVKAAIGTSAKLYLQNGNNWDEQADGNPINLSILDKYFYTIQDSGKCVSEKTPLLIAPKPERPTGVNANQTFCAADQKRVRDLAPQGADLYWYDVPSGGAPLPSGTLLQTATYYVARANDNCESDREAVNVTITPAPQLTEVSTNPTYVPVGGGSVTLSFKGTPNATVTFKLGTGAEQTIVLDNAGEGQSVQTISSSTVATIEKITMGTCSQILNKEVGIPEPIGTDVYRYQQSSDQLVCEGTQVTIRLEALFHKILGFSGPSRPNRPNLIAEEQLLVSTDGGANYTEDPTATLVGVKQVDSDPNAPDKFIYTYTFTATEAINNNKYKIKLGGNLLGVHIYWVEMEPVTISVQYLKIQTQPVAPAPYCKGATVTPLTVVAEGNDTNYTYQWYQNNTNSTVGATPILGANAASYTPSTDLIGTTYYFVKIANDAGCNTVESNIIPVTVKKSLTITKQPSHATYCEGETSVTPFKVEAIGEGLTYEWFQNTSPIIHGGTSTGVMSDTYTPNTSSTGITYYYCVVKDNCGNEERTIPVRVTINKKTTITAPPVGATYCQNDTVTPLRVVAEGSGTLQYKWYQTTTPVNTGGMHVGTDAPNYIPSLTTAGTFYYYVEVIGQCETVRSNSITFVVKQAPATPTLSVESFNCTENTKVKVTSSRTGLTFHAANDSAYTLNGNGEITPTPAVGTHMLRAKNSDGCYSLPVTFVVKGKTAPDKPVLEVHENATCTDKTKIKIVGYEASLGYKYYLVGSPTELTVSTQGVITTDLAVGTHKLYAKKDSCDSPQSDDFTIEAPKTPVTPTLAKVSDPDCTNPTLMRITNISQYTGATYTFIDSHNTAVSATVDTGTGAITDLPAGIYKLKVTQNGCASALSAFFTVDEQFPNPAKPTIVAEDAASCDNPSTVKISNVVPTNDVSYTFTNTVTNTTVTATVNRTTGVVTGLAAGTYKVTATKGTCTETSAEFTIIAAKGRPDEPTVTTEDQCDVVSTAKITNVKSTTEVPTYTFINTVTNTAATATVDRTTGVISGLGVGKYKVTATKDGCDKQSAEFEIKAAKGRPDEPTVTTEDQCDAVSTAKITNVKSTTEVPTYTFINTVTNTAATATVDRTTGVISGLGVGKYKVTATKDGCDKQSAEFEIKAAKGRPDEPTVTTEEQCDAVSTAKITNVKSTTEVTTYTFINTVTSATVTATVDRTTGVISGLGVGKYKVTATKDGCDKQSAEFEIKAAKGRPDEPTVTTEEQCDAVSTAKITNVKSTTEVTTYTFINTITSTTVTATVDRTTGVISGLGVGKYKVTATKDGCDKQSAEFEIKAKLPVPETPTIMVAPPTCTAMSAAKVNNYTDYTHGETFTITDSNGTVIGAVDNAGNITGLTTAGTYTLTITRGTCRAAAVDFDITDKLPTPAKPEITLTPASCTSPTVAKLKNQASGLTYWYNGTQSTVNPITHEIMGLAPGTYTITAKNNNNCESVASDSFEIKAQQTATTITTAPAGATYQKGAEATPLAVVATGEGTLSYKWYKNTDNNNTSGTEVGDNSPSYKPATDRVGTFYYWVEVTSDCGAVKSAVAEIKVVEGAPTIEANDDPDTTVRRGQEVAVLGNDKVNGNPATPADVDITISNDGGLTRVGVNQATGKIMIPNDAAPATYEITYKICVKNQPTICDEAKVKITVEVPTLALKAVDDDFGKVPNTEDYTTTNTVFSTGVDTLEGVPGILSPETDVILHKGAVTRQDGTAVQAGTITMNDNGSITVKQGTPVGVYIYTYSICEKAVPTNCSEEAKATFEVVDNTILAKDDEFEVGTSGGLTPSILINDILKGKVGLTTDDVEIQDTENKARADNHLVIEGDGRVTVKPGIVARPEPYLYYYTIKEKANPANTSNAVIKIKVVSFTAVDDEDEVINEGTKEKKIPSVLINDDIDGKRPEPGKNVIFKPSKVKDKDGNEVPGIVINQEDGSITIAPNTPDGVYTYSYTICKKTVPNECKTAKGILKLLPALVAGDDLDFKPVNVTKGAVNVGNILANDLYAGEKVLDHLDKITVTLNGNDGSGAYIDEQGNLIMPQGAPVKEYEFTYDLCIKGHPGACKTAKVRVEVIKDKPLTIYNGVSADADGHNDYFKIDGIEYYPKNNLKIFNRWGVLVYEKDGYTNREPFDGHSNGRATISADSKLPQGTYYYILEYEDSDDQSHTEKGWLYLKY